MSLVAYENSDSSDNEDSEPVIESLSDTKDEVKTSEILPNLSNSDGKLFNYLPHPNNGISDIIEEEDDEYLHKKETNILRPKSKIMVPSLDSFKDMEEKPKKFKMGNSRKSGLLSILPQPKHTVTSTTKSFIPYTVTNKSSCSNLSKTEILPTPFTKTKVEAKSLTEEYSDDNDSDENVQNDFFSINKPVDVSAKDLPLDTELDKTLVNGGIKIKSTEDKRNIECYFKKEDFPDSSQHQATEINIIENSNYSISNGYAESASTSNNGMVLDNEVIIKLCGTRGKRKKEEIQIVDVNQEEVLADAREWLLKGLMDDSSKRVSSSKRKGNEPTNQQKRKHQITYLAHQAKANEAELQNQWANNRMSKRQTQSKYGF